GAAGATRQVVVNPPAVKHDRAVGDVVTAQTASTVRVIIRTLPNADALNRVVSGVQDVMTASGTGAIVAVHPLLYAVTANIGLDQIPAIEASPDVVRVSIDALVRSGAAKPAPAPKNTASAISVDAEYQTLLNKRADVLATMKQAEADVTAKYA